MKAQSKRGKIWTGALAERMVKLGLAEPVTEEPEANTEEGNASATKKQNSKKGPAKGPKKGPAKK